jgi:hypothetical protein
LLLRVIDDFVDIRRAEPCDNLCNLANYVAEHSPPARTDSYQLGGFADD